MTHAFFFDICPTWTFLLKCQSFFNGMERLF